MKKNLCVALLALGMFSITGFTTELAGMSMKHKLASQMQCATCHGDGKKIEKPTSDKCIACHGPMNNIKTKENTKNKNPHQSAHYADTVECSVCHSEHKPSKDLCSTCHVVEWQNFR